MQVTTRSTQEFTITEDDGSRIAAVSMVDEAPGKGRFTIVCNSSSFSCYWNNMGERKVLEFFAQTNDDYVVGCLDPFGSMFRKIDPQILKGIIAMDISNADQLDDAQKVALTARLTELTPISDVNGLVALNSELLVAIYGPMWTNLVNERFLGQHPSYTDLKARIATVRQALVG